LIDYPADEVEMHIYVLGAGVVLVVACKHNHGLVVAEHCCGVFKGAEYLGEEAVHISKPWGLYQALQ